MLVVQAFPADFDPFKRKLYNCERERMSGRYEFLNSFFALPRQGRIQVMFMTPRRGLSPAGASGAYP